MIRNLSTHNDSGYARSLRLPRRPRKSSVSRVLDANGNLDALIARHAAANNLPEDLVRRVIKRESGGNPRVVSAGNYGLMQIKLATARSMGYTGNAAGLLDADTNMTYAVKYLAGAYHVANGNIDQRRALLCCRLLLCRQEQRHGDGLEAPGARCICIQQSTANVKFSSEQKLRGAIRTRRKRRVVIEPL